jgi:hypothetical protein
MQFYELIPGFDTQVLYPDAPPITSTEQLHSDVLRHLDGYFLGTARFRKALTSANASGIRTENSIGTVTSRIEIFGQAFHDDFGQFRTHIVISENILKVLEENSLLRGCKIQPVTLRDLENRPVGVLCSVCKRDLFRDDGFADGTINRKGFYYCVDCK